jgi:hypothetical protein
VLDTELMAFFNRIFPHGFAGVDVRAEQAPDGWEKSPIRAAERAPTRTHAAFPPAA